MLADLTPDQVRPGDYIDTVVETKGKRGKYVVRGEVERIVGNAGHEIVVIKTMVHKRSQFVKLQSIKKAWGTR